ncbi:MFS transporter [Myxococcota bacterium]|nr:MFS transporter [Myxococcota bacterium]
MRDRSPLSVVFLIVFIDLVGFGIVVPMLPLLADEFDASKSQIGLLAASYSAMQFLFAPLWGRLSDRVGRRPILLLSITGGVVAMTVAAMTSSLALLFGARVLAGIAGANIGTAQAVVADITTPEERGKGMGVIGAAFGLGFIFGPAIGGVLGTEAVTASLKAGIAGLAGPGVAAAMVPTTFAPPFLFAALLGAINLVLAYRVLPETLPRERRRRGAASPRRAALRDALGAPGIRGVLALNFAMVSAFGCFEVAFSLFMKGRFDWGPQRIGYVFAWIGVWVVLVQGGAIGPLMRRFGETRLLPAGLLLVGVGFSLLPTVGGVPALLALSATIAVGNGLNMPSVNSLVSRLSRQDQQGGVLGLHQSIGSLARIVGPTAGGVIFDRLGVSAPFVAAGGLMLLCMGAALAMRSSLHGRLATMPPGHPGAESAVA